MKTFTSIFLFFILCHFTSTRMLAQAPVINPISGPLVICSPTSSVNYFASATNSPTSYSWSYSGPNAITMITTPVGSICVVMFPSTFPSATYTLYCYATNGSGSSSIVSYVVNVFQTPSVTFSGAQNICQGSSTNISGSSTLFQASSTTIFYNWSPSTGLSSTNTWSVVATPPATTNYTVLLGNGPCTHTSYFTVNVNPVPTLSVAADRGVICVGESATLFLSGTAQSYFVNGVSSGTAVPVSPASGTTYTVKGQGVNSCMSPAATYFIMVDPCTGLATLKKPLGPDVFPNPNTGFFVLRPHSSGMAYIINEFGQTVKTLELISENEVEIKDLASGVYFLVSDDSRKKIVVIR